MPPALLRRTGFPSDNTRAGALTVSGARILRRDDDAFNYLIEFVTAIFLFIIILTAYFRAIDTEFPIRDESDDTEVMEIMRILDTLTTTPGLAGNSTEWENLGVDELNQELKEVGFAYPASAHHYNISTERTEDMDLPTTHGSVMLNAAKIAALRNITYPTMKALFSLKYHELAIRVAPIPVTELSGKQADYLTIHFGANVTEAGEKNTVERLFPVSFLNVTDPAIPLHSNYTVVSIKVTLAEGILEYPRVLVSEFNYAPPSDDTAEEWVELFNRNDAAIDLGSWTITVEDTEKNFTLHRGSLILPGKGYALVCSDTDLILGSYPVDGNSSINTISGNLFGIDGLPNDNGTLALVGEKVPIDIIIYDSSMGGGDDNHRTLVRVSFYTTVFREGTVDKGTPGS